MSLSKVKISYNGETKKVPTVYQTYDDMINFIKLQGFKELKKVEKIKLYYVDSEGELISVDNEEEFSDALSFFISECRQ